MKTKNKIWLTLIILIGVFFMPTSSCKKTDNNSTKDSTTISKWVELGGTNTSSFNGGIRSIATDASGNVYVAGDFLNSNNYTYVAKWDGSSWSELGSTNTSSFADFTYPITTDVSGNVFACGITQRPLYNADFHVAQWNKGTNTWSELGATNQPSFNNGLRSIATDASGNVYAAGDYIDYTNTQITKHFVTKWDKSTNSWSQLGGSFNDFMRFITIDASGTLYAVGNFFNDNFSPYVAKWDGSSWSELGGTNKSIWDIGSNISSVATDASGNVYAVGFFQYNNNVNNVNNIAKWNKNTDTWSFLSNKNASYDEYPAIATDVSGNVYAALTSFDNMGKKYIAQWDGANWNDFGNLNANHSIYSICIDASGNIYAGGQFCNGKNNPYVAVYYK